MICTLITIARALSFQVVYVSSKTWGGLAESLGMGRSSRTVHALAIILQYIRKKVQKHMLGREAGLLGWLIHHISSPHPRGRSAIGSSPRPQHNQDIFPHCFAFFPLECKVSTGKFPIFVFLDQMAGRGN